MNKGMIARSTGSWYDIWTESGQKIRGRLRGKFKMKDLKVTNPIAVGDEVLFEMEDSAENTAAIVEILPRRNYLIRQSVHKASHGHLIATNLDQTALVVTLALPRTSLGFIDRFLVSAEAFRIPAVLVFNKIDLCTAEDLELISALENIYQKLGYQTLRTSSVHQTGIEALKESLRGKKTLISGHSGVGKSTLLNQLIPGLELATSEVSLYANKGVHTTTFAELFAMDKDSYIIDTPGIKELGIFEIEKAELAHYFPEMRALIGACKFQDCQHTHEPKCAVIEAVQKGEIALSRYESYTSMHSGQDIYR